MVHSRPLGKRLMARVQMDPNGGCWLWDGYQMNGYGRLEIEGKSVFAHRAAYEVFKGDPSGFVVMHRCDVTTCINPDHLTLGTHTENMADMAKKGRASRHGSERGDGHPGARLTVAAVQEVRASTESSYRIAERLAVTPSLIRQIRRREAWAHVQ